MPTHLPDRIARDRERRRRLRHAAAPVVMTVVYLLLLVWNLAAFDTRIFLPAFGAGHHFGEYNPMEPNNRPADGPAWPGNRFAQR
jgi:hypothetical protein